MTKAPYVRPRQRGNTTVYGVRPTKEVLRAFPDLVFETYDSKSEANARGYEIKRKFEAWKSGDHDNIRVDSRSVEALVQAYKKSNAYRNVTKESSKRSYSGHLHHVLPMQITRVPFSRMLVSNVDYDYVQKLWQHIEDEVSTHKANHTFKVLKLVWNEAMRSGKVKDNPFRLLKLPKLPNRDIMWPTDDIQGMVKYCDDHGRSSMGTMITIMYEFCQRVVDIRQLKWDNFDYTTGLCNFTQEKTGAELSISITPSVKRRLELHTRSNRDGYLLREESTGKPYTSDRAVKSFRRLAKGYGLPKMPLTGVYDDEGNQVYSTIWLNDLRRTGITHASRAGCSDRELIALSGHKNPQMLVVYAVHGNIEAENAMRKRGLL